MQTKANSKLLAIRKIPPEEWSMSFCTPKVGVCVPVGLGLRELLLVMVRGMGFAVVRFWETKDGWCMGDKVGGFPDI